MTYEELATEMGVLYQDARAWMEEEDELKRERLEGVWTHSMDYPGGIEPHALQNL